MSVLGQSGRYDWKTGTAGTDLSPIAAAPAFVSTYPLRGTIAAGSFIKSATSAVVYVVGSSTIRPIGSWDALLSLSPTASPAIARVPASLISQLPKGPMALRSASLVRTPSNATVYLINGLTNRVPVSSFDYPYEAGIRSLSYVSQAELNAYPIAGTRLQYGITCGGISYVSAGGSLHKISSAAIANLYQEVKYTELDSFTCAKLSKGIDATRFIRTPEGRIYLLEAGQKRPITTMTRYLQLRGSETWIGVLPSFAAMFPTGPAA